MYILLFVLIIMPGILAVRVRNALLRDKLDYIGIIYQFAKFTYLITFINLCVYTSEVGQRSHLNGFP